MDFRNLDATAWQNVFRSQHWGSPERAEAFLEMVRNMPNSIVDWRVLDDSDPGISVTQLRGVLPVGSEVVLMVITKTDEQGHSPYNLLKLMTKQGAIIASMYVTPDFFDAISGIAIRAETERAEEEEAEIKGLITLLADMASGETHRVEVYMGES